MNARQLILRCYGEQKDGYWQAFCIDLNLAVQGNSLREVQTKLHSQICEYVTDAVVGEDKEFADQLLFRKSPWKIQLKYYIAAISMKYRFFKFGVKKVFTDTLPMAPAQNCN